MNAIFETAELRNPHYEITYMIKSVMVIINCMVIINSAKSVWCV